MMKIGMISGNGSLSGPARAALSVAVCFALLSTLGACAGPQNVLVDLQPYERQGGTPANPGGSAVTVRVEPVRDARGDAVGSLIGERTTIGDISMGSIELNPLPTDLMARLLRTELTQMGYSVVSSAAQFTIGAQLRKFKVVTPATVVYWDINGTIELELTAAAQDGKRHEARYAATCTDRTYVYPSQELIRNVVSACVGSIGTKVREDAALAGFIGMR
jgi:uncharacterized lipoprotein YajG